MRELFSPRLRCALLMLLLVIQGNFDWVYYQLSEDFWDGLRLCNFVFPFFLFIMGTSVAISLNSSKRVRSVAGRTQTVTVGWPVWQRVLARALKLFGIGVFTNLWGANFHLQHFTIMVRVRV